MLRQEVEYFFAALRFFTRLPVPAWVGHSAEQLNHAARYFPAVGIVIGAIGGGVTLLAALALPAMIALLLGMLTTLLATGAFHEDGLADTVDGMGGGWTREDVLRIMKDSRIGSYGAIAVAMALLLKFSALFALAPFATGPVPPSLSFAAIIVAAHSVSRFASTTLIYALDYARDDDSAKSKPLATRMGKGELALAALFGLAPCLLLPVGQVSIALVAVVFMTLAAARYFVKRIGGYTGDCLGATQQLTELAFYLGLLCGFFLIRHPQPAIEPGICYGRSDIGIAEDPHACATTLASLLPADAPLWSSPLRRCLDLARALHAAPHIDDRLMEMHFGDWELQRWDDIPRAEIDAWAADPVDYAPPGGESPNALRARVASFLRELPEVAILVTHGGVLRACVAELAKTASIAEWHRLHFDYAAVSLIDNGQLVWHNRHLDRHLDRHWANPVKHPD